MNHVVRFLRKAAFLFLILKISVKVICLVFVEIDWGRTNSLYPHSRWRGGPPKFMGHEPRNLFHY
jgi:hypothetical protein